MAEINRSYGKANWSQLKNQDEPLSTCNVTACINAAQSCGYDVMAARKSTDPNKRPSDDLYEFMHTDSRVQGFYSRNTDKKFPPNQYMEVLAYALGLWLDKPSAVEWHYGLPLQLIGAHIINSGCAIVHGKYPTTKGFIDHINALVGAACDSNGAIYEFTVDDSYGDYRTKYESKFGNDIPMNLADAKKYLKDCDNQNNKDAILIFNKE